MVFLLGLCGLLSAAEASWLSQLAKICAEGNFVSAYADDLKRVGLEPLEVRSGLEHYRFEISPAFSRSVLIDVRVLPDGSADAVAYHVPWDSEPTLLPKTSAKRLSRRQIGHFRRLLEQGEFWSRYYFGWGSGLDTREWIFEGVRDTQHHLFSTAEEVPKHLELAGEYLFSTVVGGKIPR
jgi:hypothetical protein